MCLFGNAARFAFLLVSCGMLCHGFVSHSPISVSSSTTKVTLGRPASSLLAEQLNVAFVTGNQMKVREIEMILNEMGAIDPDNPQESLGEDNTPFKSIVLL